MPMLGTCVADQAECRNEHPLNAVSLQDGRCFHTCNAES